MGQVIPFPDSVESSPQSGPEDPGAIFRFRDGTLPREWAAIAESVTDGFRVITPYGYRMVG